ncbi:MAG: EVE domain-containing protein, partial [Chromatiales bacterium]|nr:EVE domain-containing protein [Chromatiales bacterium]
MKFWLMKSEPEEFGIEDLKRVRTEPWDGVRNYQARNMMRDEMKKGDKVFFYHSNCDEPGVYGVMRIKREA